MDNKLPEAAVVMFTNFKREDGFEVSLTLRGDDLKTVATDLDTAIKLIIKAKGTPVSRQRAVGGGFPPPKEKDYVEGRTCPKCGSKLVRSETKDGRKLIKCETNKWNYQLKKAEGCSFTEWLDTNRPKIMGGLDGIEGSSMTPERDINDY